jgi:hypothetical protein
MNMIIDIAPKYITGTDYKRTYKSVSGDMLPVRDSKTYVQEQLAHPCATVEDKFNRIMHAASVWVEQGMSINAAAVQADTLWRAYTFDRCSAKLPQWLSVYDIRVPLCIDADMIRYAVALYDHNADVVKPA